MQINSEDSGYEQNTQLNTLTQIVGTQVLQECKDIQAVHSQDVCIHQIFEMQVERSPESIAVVFEDTQLTYQQLNQQANQLAHHLRTLGVGTEVLVGICVERSLEMIVGILGILKAGGAYVPLDPAYPPERLVFILEDTQAPVLLTQQKLLNNLPPHQAQVICLDSNWQANTQNSQENPVNETTDDRLIYVIYTSGSTGQPKGVMIPHRGIRNQLSWRQTTFRLTQTDKVLLTISFSFDPSVWQIFWPLCFGGQLIVASPGGHQDTAYLVKVITEQQITVLALVPSILRVLLEEKGIENCRFLKHITCGGEALPSELIERFFAQLNLDNVLHNCYGPTEASIDTTFWTCKRGTNYPIAPIGRPIANAEIHILDENLQPVPVGESGELHIGGIGLARGYLNRPELTTEKFISNPFSSEVGARLYKTGDLARYLSDGNIEFLGRIDHQVKIRGFRIELGEIEAVLGQHPGLIQTLVIAREDVPGDKQLVGYIVANPQQTPSQVELRRFLETRLPEYMVPSFFVFLDTLPLNPNGKIDRRALPAPDISDIKLSTNFVPPQNATEEVLARIWAKVLRLQQVGIHDNFFELGGHSLLATQVMSRVRQAFQIEIPLQVLFENPTIATLAQAFAQNQTQENDPQNQTIPQLANRESAPLSFAQQRVWFLEQLEPNSPAYIVSNAQRLTGKLNVGVLQQSLDAIVVHHEALRTNFITSPDGSPVQIIGTPRAVEIKIIKVTEKQVEFLLNQEVQRPFNLKSDLMLRATLLQVDEQEHILLLMMHHIASDGWSIGILWQQLIALYEAFLSSEPSPLAKLPIQYADFAVWQHQWLSGEVLSSQTNYWKTQLAGANTVLELPTDRPRPPVQTYQGATQSLMLPQTLSASLTELSHQEGVTLFMTLLAAFGTILHRYTGQENILIGSPIAGRNRSEIEGLIGFFINTVVLRADFAGNPSFRSLLNRIRQMALNAYAHQDMPFEKLVEELQPERDTSRNPLFQVWFNMLNLRDIQLELPGVTIEPVSMLETASKFDLTLYVTEQNQGIKLDLVYNTDLFTSERMMEMLHQFHHLLNQIVAAPQRQISLYSLVTPEAQPLLPEPRAILPEPKYELATTMFTSWVNRTPEHLSLRQGFRNWNYGELDKIAQTLARVMLSYGVERGDVVAVFGTRSFGLIASMLGVLLSGGVLLTLDPQLPSQRQRLMLQEAKAKYILYIDGQRPEDEKIWESLTIICVNPDTGEAKNSLKKSIETVKLPEIAADDAAYIFFTSGTTGVPKGVLGCHKGLAHFLNWQRQTFEINQQDRVAQLTGLSFDVVLRDIFLPLTSGATLCLPEEGDNLDPTRILCYLENEQISVLHTVPSLAQLWLANVPSGVSLRNLRWLFLAGEPLKETLVLRWRDAFPESGEIVNLYGPTETTLAKCYYRVPVECTPGVQPVGLPLPQTQALIFTQNQQPCGIGEPGEIVIRTPFRSLGYINAEQENRSRFVKNPFRNEPQDWLYYTGDRGCYRPDGSLEILGRRDHQVKIRGIRIEPGEIETVLAQHPNILQTVVIAREDVPGDQRLVAYIIPNQDSSTAISDIRRFLSTKLPQYMLPSAFVLLDNMPLTPNGKVDRRALPAPDSSRQEPEATFVAPRNEVERQLTQIWEQILGVQPIGVRDNFFELGGHSILAVKLFWQIEKTFSKNLPLAILFQSGTVEALAKIICQEDLANKLSLGNTLDQLKFSWSSLVEIQPNGSKPPFFCIHGLGGEVLCFRELALHLGSEQPFYGLQPRGLDEKHPFHTRVEDMATYYLQEIQTLQPDGPYFLGGYSFGGVVAFEMARQLQEKGEQVGILVMLDSCRPGYSWRMPFLKRLFLHFKNLVQQGPSYLWQKVLKWSHWRKENFQNKYRGYLEDVLPLVETDKHLKIINANTQAVSEYIFSPYLGRAILLRTEDANRDEAIGTRYDPQFGWGNLVTEGLDIHYVPGSHLDLLKEPNVQVLAEILRNCLTQAQPPKS
ncbi:MAG: non-ribosomal peptide synthetase [Nostoc sp. DedVER02]|uniref:non-ribosomal peptide synthetase n=1 Tax=unclassified Nostoc TaxID=2593658 RepID=UPI002AD471EA|nr:MULTISPECIES: non-ribosomal peptide synthetase [unclassified Nostoc]MDZ7985142.1 amino acid adenylation domain-containing protein [Nostoc sp. DedVER02]MDZ8113264.1 amino acid adenylation domain-containing protein [Nostoc sp. DedVER01b]